MKPSRYHHFALPIILLLLAFKALGGEPSRPDWELVRSVSNPYGGVMHYVLIPVQKQRNVAYYRHVADQVCGSSDTVSVFFWTDRAHIPQSAWMAVRDMRVMTAEYERNPSYKAPVLNLASWLYPTPEAANKAHCFYAP